MVRGDMSLMDVRLRAFVYEPSLMKLWLGPFASELLFEKLLWEFALLRFANEHLFRKSRCLGTLVSGNDLESFR